MDIMQLHLPEMAHDKKNRFTDEMFSAILVAIKLILIRAGSTSQ
jgi:hypothetical protein